MAHWAELNENNIVLRVTVGDNNELDEGYQWLIDNLGGTWVKTSYNGTFGEKYAGIGDTYDPVEKKFIAPKVDIQVNTQVDTQTDMNQLDDEYNYELPE